MNGPTWNGDGDKLNEEALDQHRSALKWQSPADLRKSYEIYRRALELRDGKPCKASVIQYFVATWREMRRRMRDRKM